jgi:hypothetical protein
MNDSLMDVSLDTTNHSARFSPEWRRLLSHLFFSRKCDELCLHLARIWEGEVIYSARICHARWRKGLSHKSRPQAWDTAIIQIVGKEAERRLKEPDGSSKGLKFSCTYSNSRRFNLSLKGVQELRITGESFESISLFVKSELQRQGKTHSRYCNERELVPEH